MAFTVSALSQYIDQSKKDLILAAVAGASTFEGTMIRVVEDVKDGTIQKIHVASATPEFQEGNCVSTTSGDTAFSDVSLQTKLFTWYEEFCGQSIASKYPQILNRGANSTVNWPEALMNHKVELAQNAIVKAFWQAGRAGFSTDLNIASNGVLSRLINTSASASTYTIAGVGGASAYGAALSVTNAVSAVTTMLNARPAALYNVPIEVRMDPAAFEILKQAYIAANYYNFPPGNDPYRMALIGFANVTAVADFGLAGSKAMVALAPDTLAFGCDLVSDNDQIVAGYNEQTNTTWTRMCFSIGAAVLKPAEIGVVTFS